MDVSVVCQCAYKIRPYEASDLMATQALLSFLPDLYPGGDGWLAGRLQEVLNGQARCTIATEGASIIAIAIETPKADRSYKLSTFYVAPRARHLGVGTELMKICAKRWASEKVPTVYVTVATSRESDIAGLLVRNSFSKKGTEQNRYGPGRHESVYVWKAAP